jgi:hypothetical protein
LSLGKPAKRLIEPPRYSLATIALGEQPRSSAPLLAVFSTAVSYFGDRLAARGYEPGPSDVNSGDGKTPRRAFPAIGRRVSLTLPSHLKARPAFNVVPARISTDGG